MSGGIALDSAVILGGMQFHEVSSAVLRGGTMGIG